MKARRLPMGGTSGGSTLSGRTGVAVRKDSSPDTQGGVGQWIVADDPQDTKPESKERTPEVHASATKAAERRTRRKTAEKIAADEREDAGSVLRATQTDGRSVTVRLILANRPYTPEADPPSSPDSESLVGNDGNQYYCQVCSGFGDVVCCDGCPRVYHPTCIPLEDPSRRSLDNDDDPWYCPECIGTKNYELSMMPRSTRRATRTETKGDRKTSRHRCVDCQRVRHGIDVRPCQSCGNYVHVPSCNGQLTGSKTELCATCRAVDQLITQGEEEEEEDPEMDVDESMEHRSGGREMRKRRRQSLSISPTNDASLERPKKKKKKRRKHSMETGYVEEPRQLAEPEEPVVLPSRSSGIVQAIPAFYFYLGENRWKIERTLARKHRYFNRLPKGSERNELVAREAASWWVKLRPMEHRRYMNMSMRDYEARIIEWKEEKNVQEMGAHDGTSHEDVGDEPGDRIAEEDRLTYEKHERLFLNTSVGSKPFKPEPDQSYNRVLLDLLHDMRFHPLPMFSVNRSETETVIDEHSAKVTIPYFEVHGPVSTSIGDECLGCSRGWTHFCPVLQRRIPAVEHRAMLQPPLSSLMATRIGLGLRPRLSWTEADLHEMSSGDRNGAEGLFSVRESLESKEMKFLPVVPSCSVTDPNERLDDIVQFIEETTAMKVAEPPRPPPPEESLHKKASRYSLPVQRQKESSSDGGDGPRFNKCGRCRTIIDNDTGCIQCRRAQLVINRSKNPLPGSSLGEKGDGKTLKIHTAMLGRVQMKEGVAETQSEGDIAVSEAMLKERWMPSAFLPPQKVAAPSPYRSWPQGGNDYSDEEPLSAVEDEEKGDEEPLGPNKESVNESSEEKPLEVQQEAAPEEEQDEEESSKIPPAKRMRSTRVSTARVDTVTEDLNRAIALKKHKLAADELHKKTVQVSCCGILLAMMRRDPLHLFARPVTAEGYTKMIRNPMDFGKIRRNLLEGNYQTLGSFCSDARLLCENALAYNPPTSIYYKTAKELRDTLAEMQKRASTWIGAIKDAHSSFLLRRNLPPKRAEGSEEQDEYEESEQEDAFEELRKKWPEAVQMLEKSDDLRRMIETDFMRTKENEVAFYGSLAVRRAAAAAEASLAPYPDSGGIHSVVSKRKFYDDEALREQIDEKVAKLTQPVQLAEVSTWREETIVRLMRKVQSRRLERRTVSENGCSRCDGTMIDHDTKSALNADSTHPGKAKKKGETDVPRVDSSRIYLTTGLASAKTCQKIVKRGEQKPEEAYKTVNDACVSVRGSKIHGMGLFADQPFKNGDCVAEYLGEWVVNSVADEREKEYRDQRIQDYQFRLNDKSVIDATMKGGPGRYINHNCTPNCLAKIIASKEPGQEHLRRVMIIAQRNIDLNEEITYDYQFPLELDLSARIPCNCQSDACRGFMNWDLPEKGSNNRALLVQKRGANMRDRIRRLGRPLKRDEA